MNNIILDRETEMCNDPIHFKTHVMAIGCCHGFIDHEVIAPLHYRLSSHLHDHVVEVWFDGGFWINHVNNGVKFFVGCLNELRSSMAIVSEFCEKSMSNVSEFCEKV